MSNSPSGSDNTIGRFLIEAELGQATPHTDCTRRISSGNLVVDRVTYPSFSHPSEANRQIDFLCDGVDTYSDPSLSTSPQQSRTSLSPNLYTAPQSFVSFISSIISITTNTGTSRGCFFVIQKGLSQRYWPNKWLCQRENVASLDQGSA